MAIYSVNLSKVRRGAGENAIASAAYISGSKLDLKYTNILTGVCGETIKTWDFRNKAGVVYSAILAPDGSPDWVFDREYLWNRAESIEFDLRAQTGRRLMVALPRELTQEQNIELAREFALEYLASHGMIVDLNIHYDNEHNPHMHLQMITRELITDPNSAIGDMRFAPTKNRDWGMKLFLNYLRGGVATLINKHLELHGSLDRVSHLFHEARGIELTPGIHEGAARHISAAERRLLNEAILAKNASAIRGNPELVFHKLSINKAVFTKNDIARVLSDALYNGMEIAASDNKHREVGDAQGSTGSKSLSQQYANEFMIAYEGLLKSSEIKLVRATR